MHLTKHHVLAHVQPYFLYCCCPLVKLFDYLRIFEMNAPSETVRHNNNKSITVHSNTRCAVRHRVLRTRALYQVSFQIKKVLN